MKLSLPHQLVLATKNAGKLAELKSLFQDYPIEIKGLDDFGDIPDAIEDKDTLAGNAHKKAQHYSQIIKKWVVADDSGLEIDALNKAPGVYSARYGREDIGYNENPNQTNCQKVLRELGELPISQRTARFKCALCMSDHLGNPIIEVEGTLEGSIGTDMVGNNGFGYDPIFIIPELDKSVAQLSPSEKNKRSHRAKAFEALVEVLKQKYNFA